MKTYVWKIRINSYVSTIIHGIQQDRSYTYKQLLPANLAFGTSDNFRKSVIF